MDGGHTLNVLRPYVLIKYGIIKASIKVQGCLFFFFVRLEEGDYALKGLTTRISESNIKRMNHATLVVCHKVWRDTKEKEEPRKVLRESTTYHWRICHKKQGAGVPETVSEIQGSTIRKGRRQVLVTFRDSGKRW